MTDTDDLKCSCQKCGERIAFPPSAIGELIACPHCGGQTKLISTAQNAPPKPGRKFAIVAVVILLVFILAAAGAMFYFSILRKPADVPPSAEPQTRTNVIPKAFTELNGFKISRITLKKAENGGLVNAVGTVANETDRQRFGVKIELDLLDAQDEKIGSASDYIAVLEPHNEWQFRAMSTEPKAVKAKLADIEEQK
jgi:rRNA maturation protein Nop10